MKPLKAGRGERRRKLAFTLDELRLIFSKAPDDFWRYMVVAGFYTSHRMGDLTCLTWGAVDFTTNILRLPASKTDQTAQIPLRPCFKALLLKLRAQAAGRVNPVDFVWPKQAAHNQDHGPGQYDNEFYEKILVPCGLVPPRTHHIAKEGKGRAGVRTRSPIPFHSLRHTHITLLKVTGGPQAAAKELAGHTSDAMSDLYTHLPMETLVEATRQLPEFTSTPVTRNKPRRGRIESVSSSPPNPPSVSPRIVAKLFGRFGDALQCPPDCNSPSPRVMNL